MKKEEFIKELLERLPGMGGGEVLYLEKGMTSEEETTAQLIQETNIKYFKTEADYMLGDFVILRTGENGQNISRFECDALYSICEKEGWDAVKNIVEYNVGQGRKLEEKGFLRMLKENDYDALKDHLIIRPLNFPDNRLELKDSLYRRLGDIVLVLYVLMEDVYTEERHDVSSFKVPRPMMEQWGHTEDEVWDAAMANTYFLAPPRMYFTPMETYKPPYYRGSFMAIGSAIKSLEDYQTPTVTTVGQMNGAIAMFYPGVKEKIAELFDGDYYVVFTSIHEARLHKKGTRYPLDLLRLLKDMNRTFGHMFGQEEILTRKIYLYDRFAGELRQMEL